MLKSGDALMNTVIVITEEIALLMKALKLYCFDQQNCHSVIPKWAFWKEKKKESFPEQIE